MTTVLEAKGASRRFAHRLVIRHVDLAVTPGEVITIMGPNGAGKTTLLKILAGLMRPTSGTVERSGTVDAVFHHTLLYDTLTASENLLFASRLRRDVPRTRVDELLDLVNLAHARNERVSTFSRGMQQRLSLARALLHTPDVLLLDEPFNSLDAQGCGLVLDIVRGHCERDGHAAVIVSHQIERLFAVTTSVGYLVRGTLEGPESAANVNFEQVESRYHRLVTDG